MSAAASAAGAAGPIRIGVVADVHLTPPGTGPLAWHNPYALADAADRLADALAWCVAEGAETLAVLGDLAHFGDDTSLEAGVRLAAAAGRPTWMTPGNHDCTQEDGALAAAVERFGRGGARIAPAAGDLLGGWLRVAGLGLVGDRSGLTAAADRLPLAAWGDGPVLLLSHYPLLSFRADAERAGLAHPGDLTNLATASQALFDRAAPTVVVHGHAHLRHASVADAVLQLSVAALIEPPFEATLLELDRIDGGLAVRRRAVAMQHAGGARIPALAPAVGSWRFAAGRWRADG